MPNDGIGGSALPNGITAKTARAAAMMISGARTYRRRRRGRRVLFLEDDLQAVGDRLPQAEQADLRQRNAHPIRPAPVLHPGGHSPFEQHEVGRRRAGRRSAPAILTRVRKVGFANTSDSGLDFAVRQLIDFQVDADVGQRHRPPAQSRRSLGPARPSTAAGSIESRRPSSRQYRLPLGHARRRAGGPPSRTICSRSATFTYEPARSAKAAPAD